MSAPTAAGTRAILHADIDAFFASVEQRDDAALAGKPVLVGGRPEERGVVAAASYEARRFGARSAMPMRTAVRLCPQAVIVPPRFEAYAAVSAEIMAIFRARTPLVEPLSLDEAYLDLSEDPSVWLAPAAYGAALKREVHTATGLTASVGLATTKSAAKIASDLQKPDGLVVVPPGEEAAFLAPLPVGRLWGVGPRTEEQLARLGVTTIGALAVLDVRLLSTRAGRWAEELASLARGVDPRPVVAERERKSVGRETTFVEDRAPGALLDGTLAELCEEVAARLDQRGLRGHTVTIKVRRSDFSTRTRQHTLLETVARRDELVAVSGRLLELELQPGERVRLLGVSVSGFAEEAQLPLFTLG